MKLNGQSRSFVKQVQVDLLALGDADLCKIVQYWIDGSISSEGTFNVPEETRLALGYTRVLPDVNELAQQRTDAPAIDWEGAERWRAPTPQHLRAVLTLMDVSEFAQHIIAFAYKSLHPSHPGWYDGVTFNAHLANYLRRMRDGRASHGR